MFIKWSGSVALKDFIELCTYHKLLQSTELIVLRLKLTSDEVKRFPLKMLPAFIYILCCAMDGHIIEEEKAM